MASPRTASAKPQNAVAPRPSATKSRAKSSRTALLEAPATPPEVLPEQPDPAPIASPVHSYSVEKTNAIFARFRKTGTELRFRALVSPAMAKKILQANAGNRKLRASWVETLARALSQGEWMENAEPIKFADDGRLLDGQHRLEAAILADLPFQTDIALGLDPASQITMDGGKKRSVSDHLTMLGEKYANNVPATMRWVYWLADDRKQHRTTAKEMTRFLERYPQLRDSVRLAQATKWRGMHSSIIATIHFLASSFMNQPERAAAFLAVWTDGKPDYPNDPAWKLREDIRDLKISGKQHTPQRLCDLIVNSYNLFSEHRAPVRPKEPSDNVKLKGLDTTLIDLTFAR